MGRGGRGAGGPGPHPMRRNHPRARGLASLWHKRRRQHHVVAQPRTGQPPSNGPQFRAQTYLHDPPTQVSVIERTYAGATTRDTSQWFLPSGRTRSKPALSNIPALALCRKLLDTFRSRTSSG